MAIKSRLVQATCHTVAESTSMWILIWLFFSAFILGVTGWSLLVLYQQKKAWKAFATARKLSYEPGTLVGPPSLRGLIDGQVVALFTGQQQTNDARGQRLVTVIEVDMKCALPTGAAIGTPETALFIAGLRLDYEYKPDLPADLWSPDYAVRTRDVRLLQDYLTPERATALRNIFGMKNSVALLFFDEYDCLLRMETPDPLRDSARIEKIVMRILSETKKLAATDAEKKLAEQKRSEREALKMQEDAIARAAERAAQKAVAAATVAAPETAAATEKSAPYLGDEIKNPE